MREYDHEEDRCEQMKEADEWLQPGQPRSCCICREHVNWVTDKICEVYQEYLDKKEKE